MGCAISIVKYILFLFNFIFVLAGIALLTIGILIKLQIGEIGEVLDSKTNTPAILLIVIGSIILVISFYGCCGAIRESHCMVTTYAVFLLTVLVLQIAIAVLAFVYGGDTDAVLKQTLYDFVHDYSTNESSRKAMDALQNSLECCGADGPEDYFKMGLFNLPSSCCKQGDTCRIGILNSAPYYTTGCLEAMENFLSYAGHIMGGIAIGAAVVEIVGIVFALCLASSIKNEARRRDV
ncbi:23 kDa integral membrane protein-like [Schistocerca cancellata]|uniref:23 kDa integral membrane protein-like n=1 Tax=Schistocerca cancellata TaxID=274614 RepID=UPI002119683F|nr:23 kDa integral membrane protein-like [Schistocerca cancellata]